MTNKLHSQTKSRGFPQEVHQEAFALWYKLGRPEYKQIVAIMQEQAGEGNRVPTVFSIDVWHRHEDWSGGCIDYCAGGLVLIDGFIARIY